jgi:hypothetical protein
MIADIMTVSAPDRVCLSGRPPSSRDGCGRRAPVDKSALPLETEREQFPYRNRDASTAGGRGTVHAFLGRSMMEQHRMEWLKDFLQSRQIDQIAEYMQRGARFAPLSDDDLVAQWLTTFRAMADAPSDPPLFAEFVDVEAEMDFRGIVPPYDQIQPEVDRWLAATDITIQAITRDPQQRAELEEWMMAEWRAFDDACIWSN